MAGWPVKELPIQYEPTPTIVSNDNAALTLIKKVVTEAIATLVNIKTAMADLILRPAGGPAEVYQALLYRRDESTGRQLGAHLGYTP